MSEIDDVLADIKKEGSDPFLDLVKETSTDSLPDTKPEDTTDTVKPEEGASTPEDNLPFHKHPRWIEKQREIEELRQKDEETARELAELKAFKEETSKRLEPTTTEVPEWFRELYGDNPVAFAKYTQHEAQRTEEIERKVLERQERNEREALAETQKWNKWVDDEIGKLASQGKEFDKNELIKTMLDYRPTDTKGNFDFEAGYKIYEALKPKDDPAKAIARRELADTTTRSTGKGEKVVKDYQTPATLRNRSWGAL